MNRKEYKALKAKQTEPIIITPEDRLDGMDAFSEVEEVDQEETLKETIKELLKTRWVQVTLAVSGGLFIALMVLIGLLSTQTAPEEVAVDYSTVIADVDYSLALEEHGDRLIGWVTSKDLTEQQGVTLTQAIQENSEKDLTLYVFEGKVRSTDPIAFYRDGLRFDVKTYPGNRFETRTFHKVPEIEATVTELRDWDIDLSDSYVDSDKNLQVAISVPTLATTEETVAFLKGMSDVITNMNEPDAFEDIHYSVISGISGLLFSANTPTVIADTQFFQTEQVNRGE